MGVIAMACNHKTEVYSRIVGYYRPVQQWNKGKKAEYFNRKTFKFSKDSYSSVHEVSKEVPTELSTLKAV